MDVERQYCQTCERLSWHTRWTPTEELLRLLLDLSVLTLGLSLLVRWGLRAYSRQAAWKCKLCGGAPTQKSSIEALKEAFPHTTTHDGPTSGGGFHEAKPSQTSAANRAATPVIPKVAIDLHSVNESTLSDADLDARRRAHIFSERPFNASPEEFWEWHDQLYIGGSPESPAWRQRVREVRERDGYRCMDCGAKGPTVKFHTDHIIPLSAFGSNEMDNLKTLCFDCHQKKTKHPLKWRRRW